jgi:hypothetical protein
MPELGDRGKAFIGVSLDTKAFTREWVRTAVLRAIERHDALLIVLADEISLYTRAPVLRDRTLIFGYQEARRKMLQRRDELRRFMASEIDRLTREDQARVELVGWNDFADAEYARVLRALWIGCVCSKDFRKDVDACAASHMWFERELLGSDLIVEMNRHYIVDEVSMCLRIAEAAGYSHEYYPGAQLPVLERLYAGVYGKDGLTVAELMGREPRRRFTALSAPVAGEH